MSKVIIPYPLLVSERKSFGLALFYLTSFMGGRGRERSGVLEGIAHSVSRIGWIMAT